MRNAASADVAISYGTKPNNSGEAPVYQIICSIHSRNLDIEVLQDFPNDFLTRENVDYSITTFFKNQFNQF